MSEPSRRAFTASRSVLRSSFAQVEGRIGIFPSISKGSLETGCGFLSGMPVLSVADPKTQEESYQASGFEPRAYTDEAAGSRGAGVREERWS